MSAARCIRMCMLSGRMRMHTCRGLGYHARDRARGMCLDATRPYPRDSPSRDDNIAHPLLGYKFFRLRLRASKTIQTCLCSCHSDHLAPDDCDARRRCDMCRQAVPKRRTSRLFWQSPSPSFLIGFGKFGEELKFNKLQGYLTAQLFSRPKK